MKIRPLTPELYPKAIALLQRTFSSKSKELRFVDNCHKNGTVLHEWVCIHTNTVIAYIAFSNAYNGSAICGLHLGPLAVKPEFQRQGIGSELLRFALRQKAISDHTLFVLDKTGFFRKFGFEPCSTPICPYDPNNAHFLSIRNIPSTQFTVGYEAEFLGTS